MITYEKYSPPVQPSDQLLYVSTPHAHTVHSTQSTHIDTDTHSLGSDRIFDSVRFGSAIRLISAGSVRFGFGSDYPNINRTSRARMSISNAPRVAKKIKFA